MKQNTPIKETQTVSSKPIVACIGTGMSFLTKKMTLSEYLSSQNGIIIDPQNELELPKIHNLSM